MNSLVLKLLIVPGPDRRRPSINLTRSSTYKAAGMVGSAYNSFSFFRKSWKVVFRFVGEGLKRRGFARINKLPAQGQIHKEHLFFTMHEMVLVLLLLLFLLVIRWQRQQPKWQYTLQDRFLEDSVEQRHQSRS